MHDPPRPQALPLRLPLRPSLGGCCCVGTVVRHLEDALAKQVADALAWLLPAEVEWSHVPNGGKRDAREGARLKGMGVKAGWPDLQFFWGQFPKDHFGFIELKSAKGTLSEEQREFRDRCLANFRSYAICRSLDEVIDTLVGWQVPLRRSR